PRALHLLADRARPQGQDRGGERTRPRQHVSRDPSHGGQRLMAPPVTVLIADDDPVALDLLAEVLSGEGYRVRAASGGEECLRLAAAEPVDLAIVDLRMPGVDGLQVIRRLASVQPGVPVLILTAFATIDTAIEAIREGAYDYLSKPFRMEEIKLVVRRTL